MAITKAMLARCQNELKQAFCALDKDVQEAIKANKIHAEFFDSDGDWSGDASVAYVSGIYRLSPDAPTEPEWEERGMCLSGDDMVCVEGMFYGSGAKVSIAGATCHKRFLGIIYRDASGTESMRTSVDAAFGTPVRVRFSK